MDTLLADATHIVLIDRDPQARQQVRDYLREHRLRVSEGASARELLALVGQDDVDLLLLDPQLPDDDGLLLARRLREETDDLPIVLLTDRADEADRVMGPTLAADDCIPKPSSPRDMLARLRAVLRRYQAQAVLPARDGRRAFRFAGWELNLRLRRLTSPAGQVVELAPSEFNLLQALCRAPQRVLSRDQLLFTMSRLHETEVFDRVIDVQVRRLRVKLEAQPSRPTMIVTERGLGYRFACTVESFSA